MDGVEQLSGWSVDAITGILTFSTAPSEGEEITASFEFDVPVRFDADRISATIEDYGSYALREIALIELR